MRFLWLFPPVVVIVVFGAAFAACIFLASQRPNRRTAWIRRALMVLMLVGIAMTPAVPAAEQPKKVTNVDVFFVVDKTGSMAAEDYQGNQPRLTGVKADLAAIVAALPDSRYSIISWDSIAARQLPLTTDARAVISWADTLTQENSYTSHGSDMSLPYNELLKALQRSQQRNPQNIRIVFFMSDGEVRTTSGTGANYSGLAQYIDGGYVLGYGTSQGGPMLLYDGINPPTPGNYIQDPSTGRTAISHIDEGNLQSIASQLGIRYEHRTQPDDAMSLVSSINIQELIAEGTQESTIYRHIVWPFAAILVGLLAWEIWQMPRRGRARRRPGVTGLLGAKGGTR